MSGLYRRYDLDRVATLKLEGDRELERQMSKRPSTLGSAMAAVLLLALGTTAGCAGIGGAGLGPLVTTQVWEIRGMTQQGAVATQARATIQNGAGTAKSWRSDLGGCQVFVNFDVQFSGQSVRLMNYRIDPASTCARVQIAQAFGTGTANGPFPQATTASGTSSIIFKTPLGQAGGNGTWTAVRLR